MKHWEVWFKWPLASDEDMPAVFRCFAKDEEAAEAGCRFENGDEISIIVVVEG